MIHIMKKQQKGFTLIEILLYISLSVVMVALLAGVGSNVLSSLTKAKAHGEIQYNAQFAMERVRALVKEAQSVDIPVKSATSSTLSLTMSDISKNPTIIEVVEGRMYIQEGNSEPQILTGKNILITSSEFSNVTYDGGVGSVRVAFQMGLNNPDNMVDFRTSAAFYTTINLQYQQ